MRGDEWLGYAACIWLTRPVDPLPCDELPDLALRVQARVGQWQVGILRQRLSLGLCAHHVRCFIRDSLRYPM